MSDNEKMRILRAIHNLMKQAELRGNKEKYEAFFHMVQGFLIGELL